MEPLPSDVGCKEVLDFHEAAAFLGVSTKTLAKVLHEEDLPGRKVGREWKFARSALIAWLSAGRTRDYAGFEGSEEPASAAPAMPAFARVEIARPRRERLTEEED